MSTVYQYGSINTKRSSADGQVKYSPNPGQAPSKTEGELKASGQWTPAHDTAKTGFATDEAKNSAATSLWQTGAESAQTPGATAADTQAATTAQRPDASSSPSKQGTAPAKAKPGGSWDTKLDYQFNRATGRQELPFMFEVQEPANSPKGANAVWQILLPVNPEGYRMVYTPRASTALTQGGVFEDNIGIAPPKFSISGVIGVVGTTLVGIGKSLDKEKKNGLQIYHEIEQGLLSFYERFGTYRMDGEEHTTTDATRGNGKEVIAPELRFYNFCDQEYWVVQVNQFTLTRSTQRRQLYQYDIQLTGLHRLGKNDKKMSEWDVMNQVFDASSVRDPYTEAESVSAFETFMQAMKNTTGKMGELLNKVSLLKGKMTEIATAVADFKNGLTDLVHAPFDVVRTAIEATDAIIASINDIGTLPHEFLNDMRETKRLLLSYQRQQQMFGVPTSYTSTNETGTTETTKHEIVTQNVNLTAVAAETFTTMNIPEETIFSKEEAVTPVAISQQPISDNDTILTIAAKTGTDWQQVAAVNGLEYPFIVQNEEQKLSPAEAYSTIAKSISPTDTIIYIENAYPEPGQFLLIGGTTIVEVESVKYGQTCLTEPVGASFYMGEIVSVHTEKLSVLAVGDMIAIPGTSTTSIAISGNQDAFDERLYGIDETLDDDGYMPDDGDGDIVVSRGIANIEMQLAHRIKTLRGELTELGHPEYGSLVPTLIGKMSTPVWHERILVECQMTVLEDPRVDRLANTTFRVDNTTVFFEADAYLKGQGNPLQISLPIA